MGKAKKGGGGGSKGASAAPAVKKCTCDHPFNCACGNRPPRPSKGHKWYPETQEWAGKGHKQKGASGQTASKAEDAKTTDKGKTTIAQWQRLPSTLLKEHCQREKRRPFKSKNIAKQRDSFLYRIILPDNKDQDKDMFFVPSQPVANEEQAMEEACILALLNQTPNLPHERKLPEPYRTTWMNAIVNMKQQDSSKKSNNKDSNTNKGVKNSSEKLDTNSNNNNNNNNNNQQAQASTSLTLGGRGYTSNAEKRKQMQDKKLEREKRIRRHQAIQMANKNHPVFLSARLRQQIQQLLRGDITPPDLEEEENYSDDNDDAPTQDDTLDDGQLYAMDRLHNEGFTRRQIRTALQTCSSKGSSSNDEEKWDKLYEDCLQWLCIHLDEDQLPEGFDPREGTLEVVAAKKKGGNSDGGEESGDIQVPKDISMFASRCGISNREAKLIADQAAAKGNCSKEEVLWQSLQKVAGVSLDASSTTEEVSEQNSETTQDEIEALEAIFPSELKVEKGPTMTVLELKVADIDADITLHAEIENGKYPSAWPTRVLLQGKWPTSALYGAAIHTEMIKFMSTSIELGNPMMFDIYGQVQSLFHSISSDDIKPVSLLPALGAGEAATELTSPQDPSKGSNNNNNNKQEGASQKQSKSVSPPKIRRRPRERSVFWSTPPNKTPPATAFPKIDRSMDYARKSLPAFKARAEFLTAMSKAKKGGRVVLVTGDTGCGKTTQIPQFILEENPNDAKIVIAQPRRIAATGVASRVADERGEGQPGKESVGYVVRGDSAICPKSRMVFCTTGVLLRQLQNDQALASINYIIIDEVHERHLDSDVLLCFLKLTLKDYPNLNVILMSATLDAERFAAYWGTDTPRIHIPGRTYPVTDYLLEDVLSLTGYIPPKKKKKQNNNGQGAGSGNNRRKASPWADSEKSDEEGESGEKLDDEPALMDEHKGPNAPNHSIPLEDLVNRVDESDLDYDLLAQLVRHLVQNRGPEDDGSILVFLSGAPEINKAMETLKKVLRNYQVLLLPLHGGLQPKDQRVVFQPPRNGLTKIVLSTNIAESSVTIPDCTIVIDSCREKESSYDPVNRMPLLLEQFASKASLKQRRGRAGRVREGVCYKLISKRTHNQLKDYGDPEVTRCALEQTLLSLLFLGVEHGSGTFMSKLMDPPDKKSIDAAVFSLRKLGAILDANRPGEVALTPLGMHLAGIPAPPSVGKLLVMGSILGCRKAALTMAAGMSMGRSPFLRIDIPRTRGNEKDEQTSIEDMKKKRILEERKALFAKVGNSDHSLLAAVYQKWETAPASEGGRKQICDSLGLSFNGMRDINQLVKQYDSSLNAAGYVASKDADKNMNSWRTIGACAVAALAPSQLVRVHRPSVKYDKTVEGAVEKDGVAKELKFFIRPTDEEDGGNQSNNNNNKQEERVFIHPSSFNFSVGNYSCPWLVYHTLIRTSKPFLRDVSECSTYALLLFGGDLEVRAKEGVVVIDDWVKLDAKARVGSLIGGLRQKVDDLLTKKIEDPSIELASTPEMKLIFKLLIHDGR